MKEGKNKGKSIKRIIPCIDMLEGRGVRGIKFRNLKDVGDPAQLAKFYDRSGASELVLLDISATEEGKIAALDVIKEISDTISLPLIVGGGISSIEDIKKILNAGASKISINTAALKNPKLVKEAAIRFGSNKIVVAIDAKFRNNSIGNSSSHGSSGWDVYIKGGRLNYNKDVVEWAMEVWELGAGEILLTSIDKDGTKDGYDIELTSKVSENVDIPVIASGGAGKIEHFYEVLTEGGAGAALAASLFHSGEISIQELKAYLNNKGLSIYKMLGGRPDGK